MGKLTPAGIKAKTKRGLYADGDGLYLQVRGGGARSWIYRFQIAGKRRDMGLGPLDLISLAEARDKAFTARRQAYDGQDPIVAKRAAGVALQLDQARALTFQDAAGKYIEAHRAGWKTKKHASQWTATLTTYVYPTFGALPVAAIDVALVTKVLEPIWSAKPETAGRVRGRIESVLDWATARGYRVGENPARWRGHMDKLLPAQGKVRKVEHHAALPYAEIGAFTAKLQGFDNTSGSALRFAILTAGRTGEVLGARWNEIDLAAKLWTIPAARMKSGKEHRVPLSPPAVDIVRKQEKTRISEFVFPGGRRGRPLSNMALLMQLRRMGRSDLTAHGFRSTFRDWAAEKTTFPNEVAEMALAHAVSDKVEAAYRRGDLYEKRRKIMVAWAEFCGKTSPAAGETILSVRKRSTT